MMKPVAAGGHCRVAKGCLVARDCRSRYARMIAQNVGDFCCETAFFRLFNVNIVRIKPILK